MLWEFKILLIFKNLKKQPTIAQDFNKAILTGPILSVMLKLALPTMLVLFIQTLIGLLETYFVSSLGTDVLAGVSVVFPILMLMQMLANGGFGGGLASAISRASGAGRWSDVQSLVWHGIILYLEKRKGLMTDWAEFCYQNVVLFKGFDRKIY